VQPPRERLGQLAVKANDPDGVVPAKKITTVQLSSMREGISRTAAAPTTARSAGICISAAEKKHKKRHAAARTVTATRLFLVYLRTIDRTHTAPNLGP